MKINLPNSFSELFQYFSLDTGSGPQVKTIEFLKESGNFVENVETSLRWRLS